MAKYGHTFLTRSIHVTTNEGWALASRMQFREGDLIRGGEGKRYWELSWLGVINGFPILSRFFRLAAVVEEDNTISGWKIMRAKDCNGPS